MRHGTHGNHLGHSSSHHKANMQNLAAALFRHELIKTTLAKAKALRRVAEPLITRAKNDTLANRLQFLNERRPHLPLRRVIAAELIAEALPEELLCVAGPWRIGAGIRPDRQARVLCRFLFTRGDEAFLAHSRQHDVAACDGALEVPRLVHRLFAAHAAPGVEGGLCLVDAVKAGLQELDR